MLEKDIQKKILVWLRENGWKADKTFNQFHAGLPDIHALKDGIHIDLEVKRPGENPSKLQVKEINNINSHGGHASVVHSLEEVQTVITAVTFWGSNV